MSFSATAVNSACECVSVRSFVMIAVIRSTVFVRTCGTGLARDSSLSRIESNQKSRHGKGYETEHLTSSKIDSTRDKTLTNKT